MNKNLIIIAVASALLAGAVVFAVMRGGSGNSAASNDAPNAAPAPRTVATNSGTTEGSLGAPRSSRAREREARADADLVSRYGEARTSMSRLVTTNIADLLDDAVSMGEMAMTGQFGNMMGRGALNPILRDLDLTPDQREKAQELFMANQRRNLDSLKSSIDGMRGSPEGVMELILASDAFARGDITEAEYERIQENAGDSVSGILNPLDRNNFRGGDPLGDEAFVAGMREILEPGQDAVFQERLDSRTGSELTDIRALPTMELEQLDQAIESGKKLTGGMKQMLEGMGALQDIAPMLENR